MSDWHLYEIPLCIGAFVIGLVLILAGVISGVRGIDAAGWFIMPVSVGFAMGRLSRETGNRRQQTTAPER